VVLSAVVQRLVVKFPANENEKSAEILMRLRAQFGNEGRTQMYDWSNSCKEGRTEVENLRRLRLLWGKTWTAFSEGYSQEVFFTDFLTD